MESLQSHCIHTQPPWSSGSTLCFPSWGTRVQSPGGYLSETGILLLALSRYIGDPDVIDHCGLVWGGLCPELSLSCRADNVIIPLDLTQLSCLGFMLSAGPPSGFTTDIVGCWVGSPVESLQSHCIHTHSGPLGQPFVSPREGPGFNPQGVLMWNWDSPVSSVSLQYINFIFLLLPRKCLVILLILRKLLFYHFLSFWKPPGLNIFFSPDIVIKFQCPSETLFV